VPVELRREVVTSEMLLEGRDEPLRGQVEVRWDPLTGHLARIVQAGGRPLLPPSEFDLQALGRETAATCPFCGANAEQMTPRFPPALHPAGRIRRGGSILFPNLLTYARYASVAIYSPDLHYLPLELMTAPLLTDVLGAQVEFLRAALRHDAEARWTSISANHMLPSGSSLFHPHVQGSADPFPTTFQKLLAEVPAERFTDYLATERRLGERWLGSTGEVQWLAAFAPIGFHEVRAFLPGVSSPERLSDGQVEDLANGLARALNLYAELGMQSFNLALYGAPDADGYVLNLRLVARTNLQPLYRSDSTYFERLHWQAMVDLTPEDLARRAGDRFRLS
jgi:UDPglucose--hexose-1-phosphate uridylyltransferase